MHAVPQGMIFAIYYPVIAVIGIPANLAVIVVLSRRRCGLSVCVIYYLVSMAVTDLLVIITVVILNRISGTYFTSSFLSITPVCSFRSALYFAAISSSVWLTVAFTFDRFVAISCHELKNKYCNEKMAALIIGIVSVLSCLKNIFIYFIYEPVYIINNIPWFCSIKVIYYTSPAWAAYDWIWIIFTPWLPFVLILLLNVLTVRNILVANKARKRLQTQRSGENHSDQEMEKRKKSIVLLFSISGSFILSYLLLFVMSFYIRIGNVTYSSSYDFTNSSFALQQSGYMLQVLCSCINPFIYAGTQSLFRAEIKKALTYLLNPLVKLFKM
ncbi:probable G-protein coupled receptor 139 [Rhincodon typus]|uniref:probable G-protein coupled receptor 139 n=1 Tax=Rhincodon typus TaxID=259920 RepID=UPI00202FCAC1|nr:probable G-protein coupled receptor 139 [Rhincodon typus]